MIVGSNGLWFSSESAIAWNSQWCSNPGLNWRRLDLSSNSTIHHGQFKGEVMELQYLLPHSLYSLLFYNVGGIRHSYESKSKVRISILIIHSQLLTQGRGKVGDSGEQIFLTIERESQIPVRQRSMSSVTHYDTNLPSQLIRAEASWLVEISHFILRRSLDFSL